MKTDARVASTTPSIDTWVSGSRDRFVRELTERVETAFSEVGCLARDTLEAARQQHELEEGQLRQQLSGALETIEQQQRDVQTLTARIEAERSARDAADAKYLAAETAHLQSVSVTTDRIRTLELELEASRTVAGRLAIDLDSQRAEHHRVLGILSSIRSALEPGDPRLTGNPAAPPLREAVTADGTTPEGRDQQPPRDQSVLVAPTIDSRTPANALWSEYASQLLDQIESSYNYDVESGERSSDVVDHLTEYLRLGRDSYLTRFKDEPLAAEEFDRQLSAALDAKGAIPFGRHLAIAWYAITQPTDSEAVA